MWLLMALPLKRNGGKMNNINDSFSFKIDASIEDMRKAFGTLADELHATKAKFDLVLKVKRIKIKGKQYARPFTYEGNLFYSGFEIQD